MTILSKAGTFFLALSGWKTESLLDETELIDKYVYFFVAAFKSMKSIHCSFNLYWHFCWNWCTVLLFIAKNRMEKYPPPKGLETF